MLPTTLQVLEGLLSSLHTELVCLAKGLHRPSVAGAALLDAWKAALGCVAAIALHRAPGFRPITEREAELLREVLLGIQDMWGEVVDEYLHTSAHGGQGSAGDGSAVPSELADPDSRAASCAYASSLLQCVAAGTDDLLDIYKAQVQKLLTVLECLAVHGRVIPSGKPVDSAQRICLPPTADELPAG